MRIHTFQRLIFIYLDTVYDITFTDKENFRPELRWQYDVLQDNMIYKIGNLRNLEAN